MLPIIKALIGLAGAGVGAAVPIAINKISGSLPGAKENVSKVLNSVSSLNSVERVRREITEDMENRNILASFEYLKNKNCKLIQNPASSHDQFHSLYACKGSNKEANFYYLGSRDTSKIDGEKAIKEVETINYEKLEKGAAQLSLKFKGGGQEIRLNVVEQGEGGWSHFKDVNPSKQCTIEIKLIGGDDLRCRLTDSNKNSFFYSFSVL